MIQSKEFDVFVYGTCMRTCRYVNESKKFDDMLLGTTERFKGFEFFKLHIVFLHEYIHELNLTKHPLHCINRSALVPC